MAGSLVADGVRLLVAGFELINAVADGGDHRDDTREPLFGESHGFTIGWEQYKPASSVSDTDTLRQFGESGVHSSRMGSGICAVIAIVVDGETRDGYADL